MYCQLIVLILCLTSALSRVAVLEENVSQDLTHNAIDEQKKNTHHENVHIPQPHTSTLPPPPPPCTNDLDNRIDVEEKKTCQEKENNGVALILTPYIEQGNLEEARNASKVDPSIFLGFESYSGFLTVNSTYKSQTFFWYFPVVDKPRDKTPWILWLQGGPGASSMTGLFDEIGPFHIIDRKLEPNNYTWLLNHSLVFIDNPVGTGFSYTEHSDGYVKDLPTYGNHLHTAVKQLTQLFPELKTAPLFVAGESYAGKYVPALGMELHRHRNDPDTEVNLQGFVIGNAFVEPKMISQVVEPFYNFGLLEREQVDLVSPIYLAFQDDVRNNRSIEAKEKWTILISILLKLSYRNHAYNFLQDEMSDGVGFSSFLNQGEVRRALHVGDIRFTFVNLTVNQRMAPDFLSNTRPLFEELLEHYPVLAYCGQLDQMLPCALSAERLRSWKWSASEQFLQAERIPYIYDKKHVAYYKTGGNLTWAVVRGAGHMVPLNQPGPILDLVSSFTHQRPFTFPKDLMMSQRIANYIKHYIEPGAVYL